MELQRENLERQMRVEKLIFGGFCMHHICIIMLSLWEKWSIWAIVLLWAALLSSVFIYFRKAQDFHFRLVYYVIMVLISISAFSIIKENGFSFVMVPFISVVVAVGLSGCADLIRITSFFYAFWLIYHGPLTGHYQFKDINDVYSYGIPIANVLSAQAMIYFWVRKRNETQQRMFSMIRELQQAEASKDNFLANISHEIRTPINTINGLSEVAMDETDIDKIKDSMQNIQQAGRNLVSVVGDILDFSELQSGRTDIAEVSYNITSTINDIINMSIALLREKNLEFLVHCDPNLPRSLLGDEKKIRRVIMNMIGNAIKFTNNGCVSISFGFRKEFYGINLIITIKDTGIGMSKEQTDKIFASFTQVDSSRTRKVGGIGLGLAISQTIIHTMDGVITVKSEIDKGTTMQITVPQKVINSQPIVQLEEKDSVKVISYFNMEYFELDDIRDTYAYAISNISQQLNFACHNCRNLNEMKRRVDREQYTHAFVGLKEYQEEPAFFNELNNKLELVVVLDRQRDFMLANKQIKRLYKPFYVLPVVSVLKGAKNQKEINKMIHRQAFVAPEARILVVDDNHMNILVVKGLLARYQIQVVEAESGFEAIEKIEDKSFDFIFMDHMMPEMDGIETLQHIRQKGDSYFQKVPVIALTANAIAGAREMFLKEGFADFVEKPVETSVLERVLRRHLPAEKIQWIEEDEEESASLEVKTKEPVADKKNSIEEKREQEERMPFGREELPQQLKEPSKEQSAPAQPEVFAVGDLDVATGEMYCGGREAYLEILAEYVRKGEKNWKPIQELFEIADWKNYTIAVHAVKSSMLAIGAEPLSKMAKALELAGKSDDISYIRENHLAMIIEYKRVITEIAQSPYVIQELPVEEASVEAQSEPEVEEERENLTDEEFEEKNKEFEQAMFNFDEEGMKRIVEELIGCSFHGKPLDKELMDVIRKIEMSDFMSAMDVMTNCKNKIQKEVEANGQ